MPSIIWDPRGVRTELSRIFMTASRILKWNLLLVGGSHYSGPYWLKAGRSATIFNCFFYQATEYNPLNKNFPILSVENAPFGVKRPVLASPQMKPKHHFYFFFFITNISIEICFMVYRFIKVKRIDELSLKHFKAIFDRKRGWKSESSPFFSL